MAQTFPTYWQAACETLSAADPVMGRIIAQYEGETLQSRGDAFHTLMRSIVGQQISVKAADAVWGKLEAGIGQQASAIKPEAVLAMQDDALRTCGLSRQKVVYLKAIAGHFEENAITEMYFRDKSDEEVLKELVSIKGIGKWTTEMFLIFHLMRPDVFPVDDIGVQKAIERHYPQCVIPAKAGISLNRLSYGDPGFRRDDGKMNKKAYYAELVAHAEIWRPYRTVATWYLWRSLDPVVVAY